MPRSRPARRVERSGKCRKLFMFNALSARSIASRLFLSAAFWSILILALAGLGLSALNKQWSEANFDDQLGVYLKALVANVAVPSEGEGGRPAGGDRAAIRARVLGLVLADHPHRCEPAGNPRLEVAVRDTIAAAGRRWERSRRHSEWLRGRSGRASTEDDRAPHRRRRRWALSGAGRSQRRRDSGPGAQLRIGARGDVLDARAGADRLNRACGSIRPAPAKGPP